MASPMRSYLQQMNKKFGYHANWEPHRKLKPGMIGKLFKGQFIIFTNLEDENINQIIETQDGKGEIEYSSKGKIEITTKLKGQAKPPESAKLGEADAGVIITFGNTNSVVFKAYGTKNHVIVNLKDIEKDFVAKVNSGDLDNDYVIITEIVEAETASVIVSKSKNAKIEIKANVDTEIQEIDIADASLELSVVGQRDIDTKVIARSQVQVLYKAMRIKTKFLGSEGVGLTVARSSEIPKEELLFEELPFDEKMFDEE
jgi:hypothetical protein